MSETTRRTVLAGAAGISAAVALAACTKKEEDTPVDLGQKQPAANGSGGTSASPTGKAGGTPSSTGNAVGGLAAVSEIPVGGGKVFADQKVVVTQPTAGQFKAFSATCTHQGCTVESVENGMIICPCHNSKFKASDGTVAGGPATKPLTKTTVKVENGRIVLG